MAQRDMTRVQFYAALDRNGFRKPIMCWVSSKDDPSVSYGIVVNRDGSINRRATLAHIIRRRDENRMKAAA